MGVSEVANPATLWQSSPVPARALPAPEALPGAGAAATPIAFARTIAAAYRRAGRDPSRALQLAQIAPERLIEVDGRMTARQMELLSGTAMQELDDEGLGAFSRRLPWGSYGMLARASLSAPDLGVALKRWCRHHGLLTGDIRLSVVSAGAQAAIVIDEPADLGEAREFTLVHVLRNIHGLACWYVDSRILCRKPDSRLRRHRMPRSSRSCSRPRWPLAPGAPNCALTRATWRCRCAVTKRPCR